MFKTTDCGKLYERVVDYTRTDNFDPVRFPPPGSLVTLRINIYAYCHYEKSTTCERGCTVNYIVPYNRWILIFL